MHACTHARMHACNGPAGRGAAAPGDRLAPRKLTESPIGPAAQQPASRQILWVQARKYAERNAIARHKLRELPVGRAACKCPVCPRPVCFGVPRPWLPLSKVATSWPMTYMRSKAPKWRTACPCDSSSCEHLSKSTQHLVQTRSLRWPRTRKTTRRWLACCTSSSSKFPETCWLTMFCAHLSKPMTSFSLCSIGASAASPSNRPVSRIKPGEHSKMAIGRAFTSTRTQTAPPRPAAALGVVSVLVAEPFSGSVASRMPQRCRRRPERPSNWKWNSSTSTPSPCSRS
mmetsp:Transcript_47915/g.147911  ORF Transcript_47915/g.147911 Transcript_47915/m.147911 type:complete len:286 (-) Transcript_47915:1085-1942(-)